MKVIYISSEIFPFAATGALAEVSAGLPVTLHRRGADVVRIMPFYRQVYATGCTLEPLPVELEIPMGVRTRHGSVMKTETDGITTYFIRKDEYFDRSELYGLADREYDDNFERFTFFQKAAVALISLLDLRPDVVHCVDWHTGLVPLFLQHGIDGRGTGRCDPQTVFTICNLEYQGQFPGNDYGLTNLPFDCFSVHTMEFYGSINCMKAGIKTAARVTTVSQTYAREITQTENGHGLNGVLSEIPSGLRGINVGIQNDRWNPADDHTLPETFTAENTIGKKICRQTLLRETKLHLANRKPLIGMVTRLVYHKGLDLLHAALPTLMQEGWGLVILGDGDARYIDMCHEWMKRWPRQVHAQIDYSAAAARRILSAADICLMPAKVDPCGFTELVALRYGTLPVVHATGGLEDAITDIAESPDTGIGWKFRPHTPDAMLDKLHQAETAYRDPACWEPLMKRAMTADFSWSRVAHHYLDLYTT